MTVHRIKIVLGSITCSPFEPYLLDDGKVHLEVNTPGGHVTVDMTPHEAAALAFAIEQSLEELDTRAARGFVPA